MGEDEQPVPKPAPETERGKEQPYRQAFRRRPHGKCERHQHDGAGKRRVGLRHLRRIVGGKVARGQIVERVAEGGDERDQHRPMQRADAWMHHQQHAKEARDDRHHAMPADPFMEQRSGEKRDEEWGEEEDGDGLIELEILQRDEIEPRCADHDQGPDDLHQGLFRAEGRLEGEGPEGRGAEHDVPDETEPGHLQHGHRLHGDEAFCGGVQPSKTDRGEHHEPDCLHPQAWVGDGGSGQKAGRHWSVYLHESLPKGHAQLRLRGATK